LSQQWQECGTSGVRSERRGGQGTRSRDQTTFSWLEEARASVEDHPKVQRQLTFFRISLSEKMHAVNFQKRRLKELLGV